MTGSGSSSVKQGFTYLETNCVPVAGSGGFSGKDLDELNAAAVLVWSGQYDITVGPSNPQMMSFTTSSEYSHYIVAITDNITTTPVIGCLVFANPKMLGSGSCCTGTTMFGFGNADYTSDIQIIAAMSNTDIIFKCQTSKTIYIRSIYGVKRDI